MLILGVFYLLTLILNVPEYAVLDQGSLTRTIPLSNTPYEDKPDFPLSKLYLQVLTTVCDTDFVVLVFQSLVGL